MRHGWLGHWVSHRAISKPSKEPHGAESQEKANTEARELQRSALHLLSILIASRASKGIEKL